MTEEEFNNLQKIPEDELGRLSQATSEQITQIRSILPDLVNRLEDRGIPELYNSLLEMIEHYKK